jgi:hypothetical protein
MRTLEIKESGEVDLYSTDAPMEVIHEVYDESFSVAYFQKELRKRGYELEQIHASMTLSFD